MGTAFETGNSTFEINYYKYGILFVSLFNKLTTLHFFWCSFAKYNQVFTYAKFKKYLFLRFILFCNTANKSVGEKSLLQSQDGGSGYKLRRGSW